jgi:hypothetical protein
MALDQSSLLEALDALKAAEVDDRIRAAALARAAQPGLAWTGERVTPWSCLLTTEVAAAPSPCARPARTEGHGR